MTCNWLSTAAVRVCVTVICLNRLWPNRENRAAYGEPDAAALAAAHGYGISRDQAFIDGNKRTALVAAELFLRLNGWRLEVDDADCVLTMLLVAKGDITEHAFADWLRLHSHKKLVK